MVVDLTKLGDVVGASNEHNLEITRAEWQGFQNARKWAQNPLVQFATEFVIAYKGYIGAWPYTESLPRLPIALLVNRLESVPFPKTSADDAERDGFVDCVMDVVRQHAELVMGVRTMIRRALDETLNPRSLL